MGATGTGTVIGGVWIGTGLVIWDLGLLFWDLGLVIWVLGLLFWDL